MSNFTVLSMVWRWLAAALLVVLTYNPLGWSYVHWVTGDGGGSVPLKVLAGVVLVIGYAIFLRSSFRSLGSLGFLLTGALLACLVWLFVDLGWLQLDDVDVTAWVGMVILATFMAIGVSWSHIRRRISGQVDVDDIDE